MAFQSGTAGSAAYVNSGTTAVVGAHEWSIDISQNTPEVTAFGDSWKVYIAGIREWKASLGVRADLSDATQVFVRNLIIGGSAPLVFRFYQAGSVYAGSALVTGSKPEIAYDGAAMISFDLTGCGALSYT